MDEHQKEQAFEQLVASAIESLPEEFHKKLDNVEVVIADVPTRGQMRRVGLRPGHVLFGLYEGVPQTRRGSGYAFVPPDKITIFRRPIEYFYPSKTAMQEKIRKTVLHEIGHHFGMSDHELASSGH